MTDFQKVLSWVKTHFKTDVKLSNSTVYVGGETNTIFIHHNYNLEKNGLISLLHEVGHVMQPTVDDEKFGPNRYKVIDDLDHPKKFQMLQFMNEVDAWNRGEELIRILDLNVDMKRWNKEKEESLLTYYVD